MNLLRRKEPLRGVPLDSSAYVVVAASIAAVFSNVLIPAYGEQVLQGNLEHRENISPLLPNQKPGEPLNDPFTFPFKSAEWFQIPQWASGEWKQTGSLVVVEEQGTSRSTVQRNQNDVQVVCLGQILDKEGHIWHYGQRQMEKALSAENQAVEITSTYTAEVASNSNDSLKLKVRTVKYLANRVEVKAIINEVKRSEATYTLRPLDGVLDTLVAEIQTRDFGDDGQQIRYVESLAFWRKCRPFHSQSRIGKKDLLPLLTEFLRATGQRSLVPPPPKDAGVPN